MLKQEFLRTIEENRGIIFKILHLYADDDEDQKDLHQEIVYQAWKSYGNLREKLNFLRGFTG